MSKLTQRQLLIFFGASAGSDDVVVPPEYERYEPCSYGSNSIF